MIQFRIVQAQLGPNPPTPTSFTLEAPTAPDNAPRVLKACQLNKPILSEGSPGVGKASLASVARLKPVDCISCGESRSGVKRFVIHEALHPEYVDGLQQMLGTCTIYCFTFSRPF